MADVHCVALDWGCSQSSKVGWAALCIEGILMKKKVRRIIIIKKPTTKQGKAGTRQRGECVWRSYGAETRGPYLLSAQREIQTG